jgi:putative pyruvate formate lyase activating enzyme
MKQIEITNCRLCPRACGVDRTSGVGFCGGGKLPKLAKAMIHRWEEPCISGRNGTGAIFFSGCVLKCCYCQNHPISAGNFGKEVSVKALSDLCLRLVDQGADSIELISAAQYLPWAVEALDRIKGQLSIPVIWNSGGYEKVEALRMLDGYIDIYLPDCKYADPARAKRYSAAEDYFPVAQAAIAEMVRQVGAPVLGEDGLMRRGVIIRHLVLPGGKRDSFAVLDWIASAFPAGLVWVSLMSQYTPFFRVEKEFPELNRRITSLEYQRVVERMEALGLVDGYLQERSSAKEEYTPCFDLSGIE